jgi:hypothetical protein
MCVIRRPSLEKAFDGIERGINDVDNSSCNYDPPRPSAEPAIVVFHAHPLQRGYQRFSTARKPRGTTHSTAVTPNALPRSAACRPNQKPEFRPDVQYRAPL